MPRISAQGSHHDALSDQRLPFRRFGAAVVALVLFLSFLYLSFFHFPFVKMKRREGDEHNPNDHRYQDDEHRSGGERLE